MSHRAQTRFRCNTLNRCAAVFLLALLAGDLTYHFVLPLLSSPSSSNDASLILPRGPAVFDPDGCGIPGHSNSPFHHHHYPAVVTLPVETIPEEIVKWSSTLLLVPEPRSAEVAPIGRAPPFA